MIRNKASGWMLFVGGILLQELSYMADIWIIRVLGGILWPVGMIMGIRVMIHHDREKRDKNQEKD